VSINKNTVMISGESCKEDGHVVLVVEVSKQWTVRNG